MHPCINIKNQVQDNIYYSSMRVELSEQQFQDLVVKFLYNLPQQELCRNRLGFHLEKVYFYYQDHNNLSILDFSGDQRKNEEELFYNRLRSTMRKFIDGIQDLQVKQMRKLVGQNYSIVSVGGAILLNPSCTSVLLIKSKDTNSLGFPKGKVNQKQSLLECAQRQTEEQVGLKIKLKKQNRITVRIARKRCEFYLHRLEKQQDFHVRHQIRQEIKSYHWISLEEMDKLTEDRIINWPSQQAYTQMKGMSCFQKLLNQYRSDSKSKQKENKEENGLQVNNPEENCFTKSEETRKPDSDEQDQEQSSDSEIRKVKVKKVYIEKKITESPKIIVKEVNQINDKIKRRQKYEQKVITRAISDFKTSTKPRVNKATKQKQENKKKENNNMNNNININSIQYEGLTKKSSKMEEGQKSKKMEEGQRSKKNDNIKLKYMLKSEAEIIKAAQLKTRVPTPVKKYKQKIEIKYRENNEEQIY